MLKINQLKKKIFWQKVKNVNVKKYSKKYKTIIINNT